MAPSFDDPKPPREKRKQQLIFLLPSVKARIDAVRGKVSRSEWIEIAVLEKLVAIEKA
jgi:hypothetical protein